MIASQNGTVLIVKAHPSENTLPMGFPPWEIP